MNETIPNPVIPPTTNEEPLVDSNINLPRHRRIFRCLDAEHKISQGSGKPMIQMSWEIVSPETERVGTDLYQTAGMQTTNFLMLDKGNIKSAMKFIEKLRLDEPFDPEAPNTQLFKGICIEAISGSKKEPQTEDHYDDDGKLVKVPMKDDEGKPVINYRLNFNLTTNKFVQSDVLKRVSEGETPMAF